MNINKYNFIFALLIRFILMLLYFGTLSAKNITYFSGKESELINQFNILTLGARGKKTDLKRAKALIEDVKNRLNRQELSKDFELIDLFSTYFPTNYYSKQEKRLESVLSGFCSRNRFSWNEEHRLFYESILELLGAKDLNALTTDSGDTPLMLMAQFPSYSEGNTSFCEEMLLKYGASAFQENLKAKDSGLLPYSSFDYALVSNNKVVTDLFLKHLHEDLRELEWPSKELLLAYQGKSFSRMYLRL
jgi:hypothetical protein